MNDSALTQRFAAAKEIAVIAGKQALEFFNNRSQLAVQHKGLQDYVTQADQAVEQTITQNLQDRFPLDTVIGEEMGGTPSQAVWVIDPIDGTTNFIRGIPYFCISIAFVHNNEIEIGMVYDPVTQELFAAQKDRGAYCNEQPLQASNCDNLSEAIMGLGYSRRKSTSAYFQILEQLMERDCEYRRFGSAALMLAHAAAGRVEGYFELHLNSWDALAGLLLNQEAGAYVAPFLNENALTQGNRTLVCSKNLENELMQLLYQ